MIFAEQRSQLTPVRRYPVRDSMRPKLNELGNWADELFRWYESDWQAAMQGGQRPDSEKVLLSLDPRQQPVARSLFASIDTHYQSLWRSQARSTQDGDGGSETIALPPMQHSGAPVAEPVTRSVTGDESPEGVLISRGLADEVTADFTRPINADAVQGGAPGDGETIVLKTGFATPGGISAVIHGRSESSVAHHAFPAIPGYEITGVLGQGGMGIVYLAKQSGINRPVALKMILAGVHCSQALLNRFLAEARAVGKLQHENIVRIFEIGWHQNLPYFSLEFVDGPSLAQRLGGEPMEPMEAARLIAPLARALQYAHDEGVIHRDLKPGNVLLSSTGVAKLADFGLAKQLEEDSELSRTGDVVGTPGYMAPEQARGEREITGAVDIYGLGGVLYSALTGRAPFVGAKAVDTMIQLLEHEPVTPSKLQPGVPKDLETICLKCLQKDPARRYRSAGELEADLLRFINGEPISARPVGHVERIYRWSRRKPRIAALVATATLLALLLMIGGPLAAAVIYQQKNEVVASKRLAEQSAQEALANAELAEKNELEAKENAQAAVVQEKNAIDALKSLVFQVQRTMRDKPGLQDTRMALLDVAQAGLKRLDATADQAKTPSTQAAGIFRNLGDLNLELGRVQAAYDLYAQCLQCLQQLEERGALPQHGYRHNFSTAYELLATASHRLGRLDDARKFGELCLAQRRLWVAEQPQDEDVRQNLAATLGQLGSIAQSMGDMESAQRLFVESEQMRREYVELRPGDIGPLTQWIGARRALANLYFQQGKTEEAVTRLQQINEEQSKLAEQLPYNVSHRGNLAIFRTDLGNIHLYNGDLATAIEHYRAAVTLQRKLVDEDPKNFAIKVQLGNTLYGLAAALSGTDQAGSDQAQAAQETLAECLALRSTAKELDPTSISRQVQWLLAAARSGQLQEAIPEAAKLAANIQSEAAMYFNLGCVYAQLFASAQQQDPPLEDVSPDALGARAVELIGKSYELGFRRYTDLRHDPDLTPIRNLPEYQRLLAQMQ